MNGTRSVTVAAGLAALGLAFACASTPPVALERARARYAQAAADPAVKRGASVPLYEAEQALGRTERAWKDDAEMREIERLAGITETRVETAEQVAARRELEERAEELGRRRAQLRLSARDAKIADAQLGAATQAARAEQQAQRAEEASRRADRAEQELAALQEELKGERTERGLVVRLQDVLFGFDRTDLPAGAQGTLDRIARFLREHPERSVMVEGHTDSVGSAAYNEELSQQRAEAVARYLEAQGVDGARVTALGYGESRPRVPNESDSARQQNRRVEVVIQDGTGSRAAAPLR